MRRTLRRKAMALAAAATLLGVPLTAGPILADSHEGSPEAVEVETDQEMELRAKVEERLRRDEFVGQYDIRTEVAGSEVTLRGAVGQQYEKEKAAEIARSVEGVSDVENELLVGKGVGDQEALPPVTAPQPGGRGLQ